MRCLWIRLPYLNCHFGFRGRMRYYFYDSFEYGFDIRPPNPVKLGENKWKTYEGGVDVAFRVKHELKSKFLSILEGDLKEMGAHEGRSVTTRL